MKPVIRLSTISPISKLQTWALNIKLSSLNWKNVLTHYHQTRKEGIQLEDPTLFPSIFQACTNLQSFKEGTSLHTSMTKRGAVFVVCLLITCSLWSSAIILLVLVMIVVDLMGAMAILDIQLNAVSVVNLVMAIGIAVEFCVHITHTFSVSSGDRGQLAKEALSTMGASVFSGITLTKLVGVIVLRFSRSEVFVVYYFQMYLALVLIGFLYGLVFLPVVLSICGSPSRSTLTERNQEDEMSSASSSESQSRTAY